MQINVAQLLKAAIGSRRDCGVSGAIDVYDSGIGSAVAGTVGLMRTDRGILVRGRLQTEVEITCSRCLTSFLCPLVLDIEEEYFPIMDVVSGTPLSVPDEPGCFTIDEHHVLDLTEAVRQRALLVIPMKPLCREDCAGLCSECGRNLNLEQCGCTERPVDPRWAVLTGLNGEQKGTG